MKVISGTFQDAAGNPLALGRLFLRLSQDAVALGTAQIAPTLISIQLNASGQIPAATNVFFNDELTPSGTSYTVSAVAAGGGLAWGAESVLVTGASFNLNNAIPATGNIILANPVITNPLAQQTINGFPLVMEGSVFGFSAAASTTLDAGLSRIAAGIVAVGNGTQGDITGTLKLQTISLPTSANTLPATITNDGSGGVNISSNAAASLTLANGGLVTINTAGAALALRGATSGTTSLVASAIAGSTTLTFPAFNDTLAVLLGAQTFTNKRITGRVVTVANATTLTPDGDNSDVSAQVNTQAGGTLTIAAPTGTPTDGQKLIIRVKSTNSQTYSFNGTYAFSTTVVAPTTLGAGKTDYIGVVWNATNTKWDVVAVDQSH